jgi:hypothetical protein
VSAFTCPRCGMTSHNPNDAREGYCGNCHDWTAQPEAIAADIVDPLWNDYRKVLAPGAFTGLAAMLSGDMPDAYRAEVYPDEPIRCWFG